MKNHQTTQQRLMVFLRKKSLRYKNISDPFKNIMCVMNPS